MAVSAEHSIKDQFNAAVNLIQSLPKEGSFKPSNELLLKFYAYYKQATIGPCNISKPWLTNLVARAKWDAWNTLGKMDEEKAMKSYIDEMKKIIETMPMTDQVNNFVDKLGGFYELISESKAKDNQNDKPVTNGVLPLSNGHAEAENEGSKIIIPVCNGDINKNKVKNHKAPKSPTSSNEIPNVTSDTDSEMEYCDVDNKSLDGIPVTSPSSEMLFSLPSMENDVYDSNYIPAPTSTFPNNLASSNPNSFNTNGVKVARGENDTPSSSQQNQLPNVGNTPLYGGQNFSGSAGYPSFNNGRPLSSQGFGGEPPNQPHRNFGYGYSAADQIQMVLMRLQLDMNHLMARVSNLEDRNYAQREQRPPVQQNVRNQPMHFENSFSPQQRDSVFEWIWPFPMQLPIRTILFILVWPMFLYWCFKLFKLFRFLLHRRRRL